MNKIFENNFVWGNLRESSDLTRDLITVYNRDFFKEFTEYFDAELHPLDLVEGTLDTARAYVQGWQEKLSNKSDFGNFTGRHILKAGIAARDLEYSLRQLSKSDLAAFILNWNLGNVASGKSDKTDQILDYIRRQFGPANPLEIYRIFADSIARAADGLIPLPDDEETENQYIARGDELSEQLQSDKWSKISKLPAHHALQQAAATTKQRREHRVPHSGQVADLLNKRRAGPDGTPIFAGRSGAPLTDVKRTWERVRDTADLHDVRLHDLRHTYANMQPTELNYAAVQPESVSAYDLLITDSV